MNLSDYDYNLPEELIAQEPIADRSASRLLLLNRATQTREDHIFSEIPDLLPENSLLVMNNTRVIPARIMCKKESGGSVELFLIRPLGEDRWHVMLKPAKRLAIGTKIHSVYPGIEAIVEAKDPVGTATVQLFYEGDFNSLLLKAGETPLPPYIKKKLLDPERYQTVYSKYEGSVAAPTAGLHFTPQLLERLSAKGIEHLFVTLHVGPGTFKPVKEENIENHKMDEEFYFIDPDVAEKIIKAKKAGKKIVAVGTTSVRTIESAWRAGLENPVLEGMTELFIHPGFKFNITDAIITNFHLPKSTLLMLVSAFASREFIFDSYREAVAKKYRMYSFGDAMLIL